MALTKASGCATGTMSEKETLSDWPTLWPTLVDYLTQEAWEDGSVRQTSTLLLFREEGCWKACLNDRAMERTAWCSGRSPEGLLQGLEDSLLTGSAEWRKKSVAGSGKRK